MIAAPVVVWHAATSVTAPETAAAVDGTEQQQLTPHAEWFLLQQQSLPDRLRSAVQANTTESSAAPPASAPAQPDMMYIADVVRLMMPEGAAAPPMHASTAIDANNAAPATTASTDALQSTRHVIAPVGGLSTSTAPELKAPGEQNVAAVKTVLPGAEELAPRAAESTDAPESDAIHAADATAEAPAAEIRAGLFAAASPDAVVAHNIVAAAEPLHSLSGSAQVMADAAALAALPVEEAAARLTDGDVPRRDAAALALSVMESSSAAAVVRHVAFDVRCELLAQMPWDARQAVVQAAARMDAATDDSKRPSVARFLDVTQQQAAQSASQTPREELVVPAAAQQQQPVAEQHRQNELMQANAQRWLPFLVLKGVDAWMRLNGIVLV